jgi:hypothetical protein
MAKFDTEERSFVHVLSHGNEIMMIIAVHDNPHVPRYDLVTIRGVGYENIGEYELTLASNEEIQAALDQKEPGAT